jgi:hypothetical protein
MKLTVMIRIGAHFNEINEKKLMLDYSNQLLKISSIQKLPKISEYRVLET